MLPQVLYGMCGVGMYALKNVQAKNALKKKKKKLHVYREVDLHIDNASLYDWIETRWRRWTRR
jgi:hypothetical protein